MGGWVVVDDIVGRKEEKRPGGGEDGWMDG